MVYFGKVSSKKRREEVKIHIYEPEKKSPKRYRN